MPDHLPILMLTRPKRQSERFAEQMMARFGSAFTPLIAPAIKIEFLQLESIPHTTALVFTSENGVLAAANVAGIAGLTSYCVGRQTAETARELGFAAESADGDLNGLAERIRHAAPRGTLLHLCGEHLHGDLKSALGEIGQQLVQITAYRQLATMLSREALQALAGDKTVILPLFSARSAQLVLEQAHPIHAPIRLLAMSTEVARHIPEGFAQMTTTIDQPDADTMLQAIGEILQS